LPSAEFWSTDPERSPDIHRLLVLRATRTNSEVAERFAHTLAVAYPASASDAYRALTEPDVSWPGPALVWATVDGDEARLLDGTPGANRLS